MDLMHVHSARPYWYELSIIGVVAYVLIAPAIAARAADLRIVAAFPFIASTAATSFAVFQVLQVLEAIGYVPTTGGVVAAGIAEGLFLWATGAAASTVCSVLIAAGLANPREARTMAGTVTLGVGAAAVMATAALMIYLTQQLGPRLPPHPTVAVPPLTLAAVSVATAIATLVWPWDRRLLREARMHWLWSFAAVAGGGATLMMLFMNRLTAIAAGR